MQIGFLADLRNPVQYERAWPLHYGRTLELIEEAERLALPPGTPVMDIVRTAYTADGQIVEVNEMTADASSYVFRYDFEA